MKLANQAKSVVYVIGPANRRRVKIGTTEHIDKRPKTIQSMSPVPLQVLWTTPGDRRLEDALHEHFKDRRAHGEWFDFPDVDAVGEIEWATHRIQDPRWWGQTIEEGVLRYACGVASLKMAITAGIRRGLAIEELTRLAEIAHICTDDLNTGFWDLAQELERYGDHDAAARWQKVHEAAANLMGAFAGALPAGFSWEDRPEWDTNSLPECQERL